MSLWEMTAVCPECGARAPAREAAPRKPCIEAALPRKQIRSGASSRLRPEAQNVPIRVSHLKFQRPTVIGERHTDGNSTGNEFIVQPGGVLDADPHPRGPASLAAAAQIDAGAVAVH